METKNEFVLEIKGLQTGYDNKTVIHDMTLDIKKGKITSIIGENGCGKSTLLKTIGRILKPSKGELYLDGRNIHKTDTAVIAKLLGLLPQSPVIPNGLTVQEIVEYGRFPHKKGRGKLDDNDHRIVKWALAQANLTELKDNLITELSGGQRQRAWIAMVLAQETDVVLLDEPTTYLDMVYQLEVLELVQKLSVEKGITVVMVIHDINLASRFSDELIMLKDGSLIEQGTPYETMTPEVLRNVFNIDAVIVTSPRDGKPVCLTYDIVRD